MDRSTRRPQGLSLGRERLRLCLGTFLACAIGAGLSVAAFYERPGADAWILYALGVSLTSFLTAYLLANYRHAIRVEDLVAKRTAELQLANKRLEKLGRLKDEFLVQINHELRTPLAVVREGISQVLEGVTGQPTPEQKRMLSLILKNIDRLNALTAKFLDVAQMEAAKTRRAA